MENDFNDFKGKLGCSPVNVLCILNVETPRLTLVSGLDLEFPSNTYYPPGLVCAKENTKLFCPTSGESGSPLMRKNSVDRIEAQGILSFIKACDRKQF